MKPEEYIQAHQTTSQRQQIAVMAAGLFAIVFLGAASGLLSAVFDPWLTPLERLVERRFNQGVANLVVVLAMLPILLPVVWLAGWLILKPFHLLDRKYGVKCPHCGESLTLHCSREFVLTFGQCCRCLRFVFEPGDLWRFPIRLDSSNDQHGEPRA